MIEAIEDRSAHDAVGVLARVLVGIAGFNEERSTRWFVAWGTSEDAVRLAVRHELVVRREGITSGKPFGKVARAVVRFVERGTTVNLDELEALRVLAGGGRLTYEQVGLVSGLEAKHAAIRVERSRAGARGNLISRGFVVGRTTEDRSSVRKVNAA